MSATPIRRVALYARVSTRDRGQDLETQLVPLRSYAAGHGWEAVEYADTASAGDLARRVEWRRLLDDVRRRRVDAVIVVRLDRAFRSTLFALSTLEELRHHGVAFVAMEQGMDTGTIAGALIFTVLAAVAEMERGLIAERVRDGMARAKADGKTFGRPSVTTRPGFEKRWAKVRPQVESGAMSRRQAARTLGIGQATLRRLLTPRTKSGAEAPHDLFGVTPGARDGP
jgi:DNA invertase Pin-like site-specific DNA recombinase